MAPPPDLAVPAWATWATLAALAWFSTLLAVAASLGRRADAGAGAPARMGLWGHVGELRRRLVRSLAALAAGLALVFLVRVQARWPYVGLDPYDNLAAQVFRQGAADLVPPDVGLIVTRPMDGFVAVFDVAILLAVLLTLPYVLAQVVGFLAPALRQRERRVLLALVVPAFLLFALGIAFGYRVVLPTAYRALYGFSAVLGAQTLLDVNEFVSFTLLFLLLCGAAFQTPLAMYGLARAGLVRPAVFLRKWRHAVVAIVVLAAVATPDPTPVSQLLVSGPLVALYFLGVALALPGWRAHQRTLRTPTPAAPGSGA